MVARSRHRRVLLIYRRDRHRQGADRQACTEQAGGARSRSSPCTRATAGDAPRSGSSARRRRLTDAKRERRGGSPRRTAAPSSSTRSARSRSKRRRSSCASSSRASCSRRPDPQREVRRAGRRRTHAICRSSAATAASAKPSTSASSDIPCPAPRAPATDLPLLLDFFLRPLLATAGRCALTAEGRRARRPTLSRNVRDFAHAVERACLWARPGIGRELLPRGWPPPCGREAFAGEIDELTPALQVRARRASSGSSAASSRRSWSVAGHVSRAAANRGLRRTTPEALRPAPRASRAMTAAPCPPAFDGLRVRRPLRRPAAPPSPPHRPADGTLSAGGGGRTRTGRPRGRHGGVALPHHRPIGRGGMGGSTAPSTRPRAAGGGSVHRPHRTHRRRAAAAAASPGGAALDHPNLGTSMRSRARRGAASRPRSLRKGELAARCSAPGACRSPGAAIPASSPPSRRRPPAASSIATSSPRRLPDRRRRVSCRRLGLAGRPAAST